MKAISKKMRKRQKHFPWLKTFIKEYLRTYPNCKKTLKCLLENIEREIKELKRGYKKKTKELFETINDLYLHFWWKIHWKQNNLWKNYCNLNTPHSYQGSEIIKCFGKLLKFLIYLGINLSQGASDSLWINRVLQAINILPAYDEIVCDALLQLQVLKNKYRRSYMEVLRHIFCSEIILNISEPVVYVKSLMLLRRLKNYIEDKVAKASLVSTASSIKPPSNLEAWLSSLNIPIDVNKSIVDQLFKKNSGEVFQKLYNVLVKSENSISNNAEKDSNFKKKSSNTESGFEKEEETLLKKAIGIIGTSKRDIKSKVKPKDEKNIDEKNTENKKVLPLTKLCSKIKNSKKNSATNSNLNLVNSESNTDSNLKLIKTNETGNQIKSSLNSQNSSTKSKKTKMKKKSKTKNSIDAAVANKNKDTKSKETSKNKNKKSKTKNSIDATVTNKKDTKSKERSKNKNKKSKKKPKEINKSDNVILDNKSILLNSEIYLSTSPTFNNDDSLLVNGGFCTERNNQELKNLKDASLSENNLRADEENKNTAGENGAIKEKLASSAIENQTSQTDEERLNIGLVKLVDKVSNKDDLHSKLPNLLSNYEVYSSADETNATKKNISSCPLVESGDNVLVPDTCQNDFNSFVPFNLDSWIPVKSDTSVSNNDSLGSDKYPFDFQNVIKKTKNQDNKSDYSNLSFSESAFECSNDSEVSRHTFVSNDGSQISDKYPYVSLIDIRKNKKCSSYKNSDHSNSSYGSSFVENINDSEVSQHTCISKIDANYNEEVDQIDHPNDSNYDPILGNLVSIEVIDISNQNTDNSSYHNLYESENNNNKMLSIQDKNSLGENENKDSEFSSVETLIPSKQFQEKQLLCEKDSKAQTQSIEQDLVNTSLKIKINYAEREKKQKKQTKNNTRKKQEKRKDSSNSNKDLFPPKKQKHSQDLEKSQGKKCNEENENKDSGSPSDKIVPQNEQFQENQLPCEKHSKARTQSEEENLLKTRINSREKEQKKQPKYNIRKKQEMRRNSSDSIEDFVLPKERKQCQDLKAFQDKNCNEENENKDSESRSDKTAVQNKQFQGNPSPFEKHSKAGTRSRKQNLVDTNLKAKINSPVKKRRKQTTCKTRKKQDKRKYSYDGLKDLTQEKEKKNCQDLETFANDVDDDVYLNDLSTLLPNHGDIETQENETVPPSITLNHSDTQNLSQFHLHTNTLHEESNVLSHESNGKLSSSHIFQANTEKQTCVQPNENHQGDVPTCCIETVIDEFIESELSRVQGSCNNLNSGRFSNNEAEITHRNGEESADGSFKTNSELVPPGCFGYNSNFSTPQQNNNQSKMPSVSSATENRSVENEVARSLLNLSVNDNSQTISLATNPDQRKENTNRNSGNSTFVVDCNIINDFDSGNSSRAGSSVSGDTATIKVILNLINTKPVNSSNPQNLNSSGNGFPAAYSSSGNGFSAAYNSTGNGFPLAFNSSQGLHSSAPSGQVMNHLNCSFPMQRNNSYFSAPPFFSRNMNEMDTPPDSESHLRISSIPRVRNMDPSYSNNKSNGRSSTPKHFSRKRLRNAFSHSSESANEWGINQYDLNSSFSNIPSLQMDPSEDALINLNNHPVKNNHNKESDYRTVDHSISNGEKTTFHSPRQIVTYRNSRQNIYSDESEDDMSVSTFSVPSGEETDDSLIKAVNNEISPKITLSTANNLAKNKKGASYALTSHSPIKSDNKISPQTPLPRDNNTSKNKKRRPNALTDNSLVKSVDNKISTKTPMPIESNSSENKKRKLNALTDNSLIKSANNRILPKISLHREKNGRRKLFREERWALDTRTAEPLVDENSAVKKQPTVPKKGKPIKTVEAAKKPTTSLKREYNLRSRPLLTQPTKLKSYIT